MRVCACKSVAHKLLHANVTTTPKEKSESTRDLHLGEGYAALGQVDDLDKLLRPLRTMVFNDLYRLIMCRVCRFQINPFKEP